jgi:hypothetical protein
MTSARIAETAAALAATFGLAAASWVVAVRQMSEMDMGVSTELGPLASFVALWVTMMATMMLPGAAPAVLKRAHAGGRTRAVPAFVGSYLAVWTLVGLALYAVYRPHGAFAAGAVAIAAGVYEFTPLKQHFRRCCRESVRSGSEFGALLRRLEHRTDAAAGSAGPDERHLDVRDRRPRPRPEAPAPESRHRCAGGAGDRRTWDPDRHRALVGSRTHATDVRRHRWATPSCCDDKKERDHG